VLAISLLGENLLLSLPILSISPLSSNELETLSVAVNKRY